MDIYGNGYVDDGYYITLSPRPGEDMKLPWRLSLGPCFSILLTDQQLRDLVVQAARIKDGGWTPEHSPKEPSARGGKVDVQANASRGEA